MREMAETKKEVTLRLKVDFRIRKKTNARYARARENARGRGKLGLEGR